MKNTKKTTQTWYFFETLTDMGLGADEAKIYEYLLKNKGEKASSIATAIGLSRVLTYRGLDKLVKKGVIEKIEENGAVAIFEAHHPSHLSKLLEKQKQLMSKAELELQRDLGPMASFFNLASGKPNVQFFEGDEAIKKITGDYPAQDTEIRQWIDIELALTHLPKESLAYFDHRLEKNISKRIIAPNNTLSLEYKNKQQPLTDIRILENQTSLPTSIQIYDNIVTILTFSEQSLIGVRIEDHAIAEIMKIIFDTQWVSLEETV